MLRFSGFYRCRRTIAYCYLAANEIGASISLQHTRKYVADMPPSNGKRFPDVVRIFVDRCGSVSEKARREFEGEISDLKDEILRHGEDFEIIKRVLEEKGISLFRKYHDGSAVTELMRQLKHCPNVAMEVFSWRRNREDIYTVMTAEEYSKGISVAGMMSIDLAVVIFEEAISKQLKTTSIYNALMGAYLYNGLPMKCQEIFQAMKMEAMCAPSIVTYNILISAFGRLLLTDHMEATLVEIHSLNLFPTVNTYKALISGYLKAWMWEKMEQTYQLMESGPLKPDISIYLLMLRGYANSGMVGKMEKIYDMVKYHVNDEKIPLIRAMICAYCKSSDAAKVEKIGDLLSLIPDSEYRPWLNVLLICLYAKEDRFDHMENSINEAFQRNVYITKASIMRCIISSYFRHNAVDKLSDFVRLAENAGWKLCRSLYHCKMVMYALHMRLDEMEGVLGDMSRINMPLSKKTLVILYIAYERWGGKTKARAGCWADVEAWVYTSFTSLQLLMSVFYIGNVHYATISTFNSVHLNNRSVPVSSVEMSSNITLVAQHQQRKQKGQIFRGQ